MLTLSAPLKSVKLPMLSLKGLAIKNLPAACAAVAGVITAAGF